MLAWACAFIGQHAGVAQLVEHLICNQRVGGSNPFASSSFDRQRGGNTAAQICNSNTLHSRKIPGTWFVYSCLVRKRGAMPAKRAQQKSVAESLEMILRAG